MEVVNGICAQESSDGAMIARVARSGSYFTVRAYLAWRDRQNHAAKGEITLLVWMDGVAQQATFRSLGCELIESGRRCFAFRFAAGAHRLACD
jgi:hypothetical protein